MTYIHLIALVVVLIISVLALWLLQYRARRRTEALERLLDGTDALELLLQATRERMAAMKSVVDRVPSDIGAVAQASLDADAPVHQGLRNVLEHRLWIARHGGTAPLRELEAAVAALDRSRERIASRLSQLEDAGAELAEVTREALEQQAREPAALRRRAANGDG